MQENVNKPMSPEAMVYICEWLAKLRAKVNEFFDKLEFKNDTEGR